MKSWLCPSLQPDAPRLMSLVADSLERRLTSADLQGLPFPTISAQELRLHVAKLNQKVSNSTPLEPLAIPSLPDAVAGSPPDARSCHDSSPSQTECPSNCPSIQVRPLQPCLQPPLRSGFCLPYFEITQLNFKPGTIDFQPRPPFSECKPASSKLLPFALVIFQNDFSHILRYCLWPEREPVEKFDSRVGVDARQLLRLMDQHRLRVLRKEQKIKKVVNLAFRILLKKYLAAKYGRINHVSDEMKRGFHHHYFGHLRFEGATQPRCGRDPKMLGLALTYNRSFFAKIQQCESFMRDLREALDQIRQTMVSTIRADLRRFLRHLERFVIFDHPELDKRVAIQQCFDLRNKDNRRQGLKFPWSEAQFKEAVQCVVEEMEMPLPRNCPG